VFAVEMFLKNNDIYESAHSRDLFVCDFFVWGDLKSKVFQRCSADLQNLKLRILRK
jgi:hypothetical protein